jgi:predicted Zn-dependent protease
MRHRLSYSILFTLIVGVAIAQDSAQLSTKREVMLGDQMAATIRTQQPMVTDPEVTAFVDRVLGALSRNERLRLPINISLIDNSDLIASALPGGHLVLSSGAILRADSEAEVAGLLAHALGHAQSGQFYNSGKTPQLGTIPLVFVGDQWGVCRRTSLQTILMPVAMREQSGLFETQADMLGLGYMTNAGYDPQALAGVFDHWTGKIPLSDDTKTKALELRNAAVNPIENSSDFDAIKARLTPPRVAARRPTLIK